MRIGFSPIEQGHAVAAFESGAHGVGAQESGSTKDLYFLWIFFFLNSIDLSNGIKNFQKKTFFMNIFIIKTIKVNPCKIHNNM